jgi:hypothetical protein
MLPQLAFAAQFTVQLPSFVFLKNALPLNEFKLGSVGRWAGLMSPFRYCNVAGVVAATPTSVLICDTDIGSVADNGTYIYPCLVFILRPCRYYQHKSKTDINQQTTQQTYRQLLTNLVSFSITEQM